MKWQEHALGIRQSSTKTALWPVTIKRSVFKYSTIGKTQTSLNFSDGIGPKDRSRGMTSVVCINGPTASALI